MRRVDHIMKGTGDTEGTMMDDDKTVAILARLDERTERIEADVAQLKHVVCEGNGTPALTVQVARQDERVKALEEDSKLSKLERAMLFGGTGGGIVAIIHAIMSLLGRN